MCCNKAKSDKSTKHVLPARLLRLGASDPPARRARAAAANSAALRQHFGDLTGAFLTPFTAFWRPVGPPPGSGPVPVQGAPHLPPFSHTDFLEGLAQFIFPSVLLERFGSQVRALQVVRILQITTFVAISPHSCPHSSQLPLRAGVLSPS